MIKNINWAFGGGLVITHLLHKAICDNTRPPKNPMDCENPTCKSKSDMIRASLRKKQSSITKEAPPIVIKESKSKLECPVDKDELGKSTWTLLHTMAAYYPEEPEEEDKLNAINFLTSLASLYPCPVCAADFQESVKKSPPDVGSRSSLVLWTCRLHNEVNAKLGKELVECRVDLLDSRWRQGLNECDDPDEEP